MLLYKYTMMYQTQPNFIMFIIVLGQHVSILIGSSSGPFKKKDPYFIYIYIYIRIYFLRRA